jgi:hypothetical protein
VLCANSYNSPSCSARSAKRQRSTVGQKANQGWAAPCGSPLVPSELTFPALFTPQPTAKPGRPLMERTPGSPGLLSPHRGPRIASSLAEHFFDGTMAVPMPAMELPEPGVRESSRAVSEELHRLPPLSRAAEEPAVRSRDAPHC